MAKPLKIPTNTAKAQGMASDPNRSAWVSANAGSGKTFVLTQRVIRLLLDGTDPSRILCLTFTKAAAAEMSNRIFKELGAWSTLNEESLKEKITAIEGKPTSKNKLMRARQLFSKALETPGGLKVQTIHAFCEALLHQFPIEANVPGHFSVIDSAAQMALINEAKRMMILNAHNGSNPTLTKAFATVLDHASDFSFESSLDELISKRDAIGNWLSRIAGQAPIQSYIFDLFDLDENATKEILGQEFDALSKDMHFWKELALLASSSDKVGDKKLASAFFASFETKKPLEQYEFIKPVLLTQEEKPRSRIITKFVKDAMPNAEEKLITLCDDLLAFSDRLKTLEIATSSAAFFTLADDLLSRFNQLKKQRGLLDFEDLIIRTANLLQRSDARAWVQYKLDRGIDHLLIDEAQDTSPRQWEVIDALVDEFYAGAGSRDYVRTVFAVGDEKQSIYSFQGAEPNAFADQRDRIAGQANDAEQDFEKISLALSFRSTLDVLSAVDKVFEKEETYKSLGRDAQKPIHDTIRRQDPGCVELWPIFQQEEIAPPEHWADPIDHLGKDTPIMQLASNIADEVAHWIKNNEQIYDKDKGGYRPIRAGDINILVRKRSQFTTALVRAFRNRSINVAGTDKLIISDHIAIQDLIALGQSLIMREDDLSLACVLKSPLFNLTENELFELSNGRNNLTLRQNLKIIAQENDRFLVIHECLNKWQKMANYMPVYEFYAQILSTYEGRKKFTEHFGREVHDVLDAFLLQALNSETIGLPGLEAFLSMLTEVAPEIKREQDLEKDEVRIMTVHASKGLEAPIVFLVDHGAAPFDGRHKPKLVEIENDKNQTQSLSHRVHQKASDFVWFTDTQTKANTITQHALERVVQKAEEEYLRLLYVGMTRAADRLILCGYTGKRDQHKNCWYNVVKNALNDEMIEIENAAGLEILRWQKNHNAKMELAEIDGQDLAQMDFELPTWVNQKMPTDPPLPKPLTPSGAALLLDEFEPVTEPVLNYEGTDEGIHNPFERGQIIHTLLQYLPELPHENRQKTAQDFLLKRVQHWSDHQRQQTLDRVLGLLNDPKLSRLFNHENARSEAAITGTLEIKGKLRLINGQIDRLIELDDEILLIDYKSNSITPQSPEAVPEAYLLQMALYHKLLQEIYPEKAIKAYLLWTNSAQLMPLSQNLLDKTLDTITKT